MERSVYMTPELYRQYDRFACKVEQDLAMQKPTDPAQVLLAEDIRQLLPHAVAPVTEPGEWWHHFPVSGAPQHARRWLDGGSHYRFVLTDDDALTADELQAAVWFADRLNGTAAFALIAPDVMVMLEADGSLRSRLELESEARAIMARLVQERLPAVARTPLDGRQLAVHGPRVLSLMPADTPPGTTSHEEALAQHHRVLDACELGRILLLAAPAGQEQLLAYPPRSEDEWNDPYRPAHAEPLCIDPHGGND